jgi:hypothetical protein
VWLAAAPAAGSIVAACSSTSASGSAAPSRTREVEVDVALRPDPGYVAACDAAEEVSAIVLPLLACIGVEGIRDTVGACHRPMEVDLMENDLAPQGPPYTPFQLDRAARLARVLEIGRRTDLGTRETPVLKLCGPRKDGPRDVWMLRKEPFMFGLSRVAAGLYHDLVTQGCADLARQMVAQQAVACARSDDD